MNTPRNLMPVFIDVVGRTVLVAGGGPVAQRKVEELLEAGASVRVVAPEATEGLMSLARSGQIEVELRTFAPRDVEDVWLVVAATDVEEVQRAIAGAAGEHRVFCIAVDDPRHASAYGASVLRRGPLTVAISTSGEAPALARLLREVLEHALPEEGWVEEARALRQRWKSEHTPMASRFTELVRLFYEKARHVP